jgi:hypothetical protein
VALQTKRSRDKIANDLPCEWLLLILIRIDPMNELIHDFYAKYYDF